MITALTLARCGLVGLVLGLVFFGALWLTVRRLPETSRPALTVVGSYVLRLALATAGFVWLAWQGIGCLLAGLVGFVIARQVWMKRVGAAHQAPRHETDGVRREERTWS